MGFGGNGPNNWMWAMPNPHLTQDSEVGIAAILATSGGAGGLEEAKWQPVCHRIIHLTGPTEHH